VVKASRVVRLKECPNAKAPCVPQVIEEAMKGVAQNWKQDSDGASVVGRKNSEV